MIKPRMYYGSNYDFDNLNGLLLYVLMAFRSNFKQWMNTYYSLRLLQVDGLFL